MLGSKGRVIKEPGCNPRDMEWVFVPLESSVDITSQARLGVRFQRGELTPEHLVLQQTAEYGAKLIKPFLKSPQSSKHLIGTSNRRSS